VNATKNSNLDSIEGNSKSILKSKKNTLPSNKTEEQKYSDPINKNVKIYKYKFILKESKRKNKI